VDIPCELVSRYVDEPLLYWATDLTCYGAWLETPYPMELGEKVVICFAPTVWWPSRELMLFAEVTRLRVGRTASERGMGVEFLDASPHELRALGSWLHRRPPPLPKRRARGVARRALPTPRCALAA
jgi:hypothetical protein